MDEELIKKEALTGKDGLCTRTKGKMVEKLMGWGGLTKNSSFFRLSLFDNVLDKVFTGLV